MKRLLSLLLLAASTCFGSIHTCLRFIQQQKGSRMSANFIYGTKPDNQEASFDRASHEGMMLQARGQTGSGKSLFLANHAKQCLRPYRVRGKEVFDPLFIVDLSGDLFFYNLIKDECKKFQRTFKWLSLDPADKTHHFAPLQSCQFLSGSASRKANFAGGGLNLFYTEGDKGYFSKRNFSTIRNAFLRLQIDGIDSPSLLDLAEVLAEMAKQHTRGDAAEALFAIDQLLDYPQLSPSEDPENEIDIAQALEHCHVVYAFLPTLIDQASARSCATLFSHSVVVNANYRKNKKMEPRTIPLIIEEAAQIIQGQSFSDALTLSRKTGIRILVSHQSTAQLGGGSHAMGMAQVIRDNCGIKVLFNTDAEDLPELLWHSKDDPNATRKGVSAGLLSLDATQTQQEMQEPLLKRNAVLDVNATFGEAFLIFNEGKEHAEPLRIKTQFPTTKAKYDELSNKPIPANTGGDTKPPVPHQRPIDKDRKERLAKLRDLMQSIQADQRRERG